MKEKNFTVADVRELIPWLEDIFLRIGKELEQQRKLLDVLMSHNLEMQSNGGGTAEAKLKEARTVYEETKRSIDNLLASVLRLGILVKDISNGLVDFPSIRDGKIIYLCWKKGEPDISFWHETNAGFRGRQPL